MRGYHGTSIALVSKHSGLPASSIYWHFKSKDDLFAAMIERSFDAWMRTSLLLSMRRPGVERGEQLRSNMREQAKGLIANPEFLRLGLLLSLEQHRDEPRAGPRGLGPPPALDPCRTSASDAPRGGFRRRSSAFTLRTHRPRTAPAA